MNNTSFSTWLEEIGPIYLTEAQIQERVGQLAAQISQDYAGKDLVIIGVLRGVLFFYGRLVTGYDHPGRF